MELIEEYNGVPNDANRYGTGYYDYAIKDCGVMGADFINYYKGIVKMGDTPSLLYMMHGDPNVPQGESWGGSFEPIKHSSRRISCFVATIDKQQWAGYYLGKGTYMLRYSPKAPSKLSYKITSSIKQLNGLHGSFVVDGVWPGKPNVADYQLGANWYSDRSNHSLYEGKWQGAKTQRKWRKDILEDWTKRWSWLK